MSSSVLLCGGPRNTFQLFFFFTLIEHGRELRALYKCVVNRFFNVCTPATVKLVPATLSIELFMYIKYVLKKYGKVLKDLPHSREPQLHNLYF